MAKIDHVRMIVIGKNKTFIHKITEYEAALIRQNAFFRPGNVTVEGIQNGVRIKDSVSETLLTAVFENEQPTTPEQE